MTQSAPSVLSAAGVFEKWAAVRCSESSGARKLSPRSLATFRWSWKSWCRYLEDHAVPWHEASATHVLQFLSKLKGSRTLAKRRVQGKTRSVRGQASDVTRSRYAKLLQEVYSFAIVQGLVTTRNPVPPRPVAAAAAQGESLVLNEQLWRELVRAAAREEPADWTGVRDTALVLLMLQLGLTVSELRALTIGDITHPQMAKSPGAAVWLPDELPGMARCGPVRISVTQTARANQARQLEVDEEALAALTQWLVARCTQLTSTPLPLDAPLFVSRKRLGALTPKTLFLVANTHIRAVLGRRFVGPGGELALAHAGPTTLRNACLARWLARGMDAQEVARRAGLLDANSLTRLRQPHTESKGVPP